MSDSSEQRILQVIDNDPLAKSLLETEPDLHIERSALAIPPNDLADNFTTGTMGLSIKGEAIAPAVLVSKLAGTVVAAYHIGHRLTGHVGFAHGGALATIFDECCGRACLAHFQRENEFSKTSNGVSTKMAAMTARLSVSYLAPVAIDSIVLIQAVVAKDGSTGRKAVAEAKLWTIANGSEEQALAAEAHGLFIAPKST